MKIKLAKKTGFCMGVRRAMDMAIEASAPPKKDVYTFGPLIHNPCALELLKSRGVIVMDDIPEKGSGTVIIRAHGVVPSIKEKLKGVGFDIVDATCPRVVKVQMLARHFTRKGYDCILIGDKGHPEVLGILGHAEGKGFLVSEEKDIDSLPLLERYIILVQTTQDRERFKNLAHNIMSRYPGGRIFNTICDSTHKRQEEVRSLAREVDVVVVVGGRKSANTRRLAEIVEKCGKKVMAVETEKELDVNKLSLFKNIGITAGASTPGWVIDNVVRKIEGL
jgi:4-hydroxy-3-methylbut-2-enyl diphosphate reductase